MGRTFIKRVLWLLPMVTLLLSGCFHSNNNSSSSSNSSTSSTTSTIPPVNIPVQSVALSETSQLLNVGDTYKLTATITPYNATNKNISWSASDEDVLSVNNGLVTALAEGQSDVTVTTKDGNKTASCHFTVQSIPVVDRYKTIEVYSTNDFHGAVEEEYNNMGLGKWATYLNNKGKQINTLLLDQGDTWQGSIYSNYNHGELITDVMNYIKFDARSVGNHDFDWGVERIASNTARSYNGYSTPVLAGNVYDYTFDTKTVGTHQQSDLGVKSIYYTLENGLKVGILGGIGKDQITSICSLYTKDICFTDHIEFIKSEATYLRDTIHCNLVIASIHTGQASVMYNGLSSYIDLVLCGHTHEEEYANEGSLYYVQSLGYGQSIGHTTLTYDTVNKEVTNTSVEYISAADVKNEITAVDTTIENLINTYNAQCSSAANQVVASNVSGSWYSSEQMPNLMCKAIYDEAVKEGYTGVLLGYVNSARKSKYESSWTYADLYDCFPFDNAVFIADITGKEFKYEIKKHNNIYRSSSFTDASIIDDQTYKIAVIDYVYFHTNSDRDYDYFSQTGGSSTVTLNKNYREILRDWLIENHYNTGASLSASSYSSSLWQHDRSQLPS